MSEGYLIVGLGNPGTKYENNRHNLGFMVVKAFAAQQGWSFKRGWRLKGHVAKGLVDGKRVHLLLPTTYMNLSGNAVQKSLDYYKIALQNLMVIVDDVYLKLGTMRLRAKGSAGGHNGLKSIEECLETQEYPRLRLGVDFQEEREFSNEKQSHLKEYVLTNFNVEEQKIVSQVIKRGIIALEDWLNQGFDDALQRVGELNQQLFNSEIE